MTLQQLFQILKARWLVILGVLTLVMVTTLVVSLFLPKEYSAQTSVVIDTKTPDPILGVILPGNMTLNYMVTQMDVIQSTRVAKKVVELLRLDEAEATRQQWQEVTEGKGDIKVWLAELLKTNLTVQPSRDSNVINIIYTAADPQFAAAVANAYTQAYIDINLELKVEPARQYARWFEEQSTPLRASVEAAQKRLSDYQIKNGIVASDERLDMENVRLSEIASQLVVAEGQRMDSGSRKSESAAIDSLPEILQSDLVQGLKADLARSEARLEQLTGRVGRNHPDYAQVEAEIKSLRAKINSESQRIISSIGTSNRVDSARVGELRSAFETQKKRVLQLKAQRDQIAVLQRDVEAAKQSYDLVAQRQAQSNLESQTQQTNVAVLTAAAPPLTYSSPNFAINLLIALFIGTLLGLSAALLLELVDQRVRGIEDLSQLVDAPVLGVVPLAA
ncbi:MAG: chain length determinant protein EpsF [Pseudomonadota bacterium]